MCVSACVRVASSMYAYCVHDVCVRSAFFASGDMPENPETPEPFAENALPDTFTCLLCGKPDRNQSSVCKSPDTNCVSKVRAAKSKLMAKPIDTDRRDLRRPTTPPRKNKSNTAAQAAKPPVVQMPATPPPAVAQAKSRPPAKNGPPAFELPATPPPSADSASALAAQKFLNDQSTTTRSRVRSRSRHADRDARAYRHDLHADRRAGASVWCTCDYVCNIRLYTTCIQCIVIERSAICLSSRSCLFSWYTKGHPCNSVEKLEGALKL